MLALTFSIKQTGVPLGTAIAGAAVPVLVLGFGWQGAALVIGMACALCAALLVPVRARYDAERNAAMPVSLRSAFAPVTLIVRDRALLELSLVSLIYGGMQITLRHYPCGHVITPDMLADMNRWMMELVASPAAATS